MHALLDLLDRGPNLNQARARLDEIGQADRDDDETMEVEVTEAPHRRPAWTELPPRALAFRLAHIAYGVVGMTTFGYVWLCALKRRRNRKLAAAVGFLGLEGAALVIGRGNCPFGRFQRRLGDDVPMFELFLPPRAAKAAVPVLAWLSVAGMVAVALRPPRPSGVARGRSCADRELASP